jgi:hypothetical protein
MNDLSQHKRRHRRNQPAPAEGVVVVRGDVLAEASLRTDAADNHDLYGFYGISVFAAVGSHTIDSLAATKLRRAELLVLLRVSDLIRAGLELWDTGEEPHYDVVHEALDALVSHLVACPHTLKRNPHFEPAE